MNIPQVAPIDFDTLTLLISQRSGRLSDDVAADLMVCRFLLARLWAHHRQQSHDCPFLRDVEVYLRARGYLANVEAT